MPCTIQVFTNSRRSADPTVCPTTTTTTPTTTTTTRLQKFTLLYPSDIMLFSQLVASSRIDVVWTPYPIYICLWIAFRFVAFILLHNIKYTCRLMRIIFNNIVLKFSNFLKNIKFKWEFGINWGTITLIYYNFPFFRRITYILWKLNEWEIQGR